MEAMLNSAKAIDCIILNVGTKNMIEGRVAVIKFHLGLSDQDQQLEMKAWLALIW